jgi:hypothetical protein
VIWLSALPKLTQLKPDVLGKAKLMSSPRKDLICQNIVEVKEKFLVIEIDNDAGIRK